MASLALIVLGLGVLKVLRNSAVHPAARNLAKRPSKRSISVPLTVEQKIMHAVGGDATKAGFLFEAVVLAYLHKIFPEAGIRCWRDKNLLRVKISEGHKNGDHGVDASNRDMAIFIQCKFTSMGVTVKKADFASMEKIANGGIMMLITNKECGNLPSVKNGRILSTTRIDQSVLMQVAQQEITLYNKVKTSVTVQQFVKARSEALGVSARCDVRRLVAASLPMS